MERPRLFLDCKTTTETSYQELLDVEISKDVKGVSYLTLMLDPDPKALYNVLISTVLNKNDVEIPSLWILELPHLTSGVYEGFKAGDHILIKHKSTDGTTVKTAISLEFNEVPEERRPPC